MERLEFQLKVSGYPLMDEEAKRQLLSEETLQSLEHSLQTRLPKFVTAQGSLAVRVEQTAVFITDDWVVSIFGQNLIRCVSAMLILMSATGRQLATSIDVELLTVPSGQDYPLERAIRSNERRQRLIGAVKWAVTIGVSATMGALLQCLVSSGV